MSQNNGSAGEHHDHDHEHDHEHDEDFDDALVGALLVYAPGTERIEGVIVMDLDAEDHDRFYVADEDADPEVEVPGFGSVLECLPQVAEALSRVGGEAAIASEDPAEWDSDIVLFDGNWALIRTAATTWGVWGADPDEEDDDEESATLVEFAQGESPLAAVQAFLTEYEQDVLEAYLADDDEDDEDDGADA